MGKQMRLDKFLVEMGVGTRSQIKEMAKRGRIEINGLLEKKTETKIDPDKDTITCDGVKIIYTKMEYYMLNKPQGVVSATEDKIHRTVLDLIMDYDAKFDIGEERQQKRNDLFPVGRLDMDTEGLLLITNDGELAHNLLSPRRHVDKKYYAKIRGKLPEDAKQQFEEGLTLSDGTHIMPAILEILGQNLEIVGHDEGITEVMVTIREGKFHQIKRMFEVLGCKVVFLRRLSMGSLVLDKNLEPGEYRCLFPEEIEAIKRGLKY
ncbi:MAG: rRNA pseudouridine synthase [Hungatella sp.]|nr:rRNA pseudouridine synthase [Hungatella sp.]